MPKTISLWERTKRIIAHLFEMETKFEIQERVEAQLQAEIQKQLQLEHHQHIRSLMVENADLIEAWNKEREEFRRQLEIEAEERRLEEERIKEREEAVRLYRDNRRLQGSTIYLDTQDSLVEEDID
jgi:hypothetical protein